MATFMPFPSSGLPNGSFKFHASGAPIVGPPIFGASSLVALLMFHAIYMLSSDRLLLLQVKRQER